MGELAQANPVPQIVGVVALLPIPTESEQGMGDHGIECWVLDQMTLHVSEVVDSS